MRLRTFDGGGALRAPPISKINAERGRGSPLPDEVNYSKIRPHGADFVLDFVFGCCGFRAPLTNRQGSHRYGLRREID